LIIWRQVKKGVWADTQRVSGVRGEGCAVMIHAQSARVVNCAALAVATRLEAAGFLGGGVGVGAVLRRSAAGVCQPPRQQPL
jgi:hypothetical protein